MKRILVTGANKGIGLAIVQKILTDEPKSFVYLGSRDLSRGIEAVKAIETSYGSGRVKAVCIDVVDPASISSAAASIKEELGNEMKLYGIVNNAGIAQTNGSLKTIMDTNFYGVLAVTDSFLPLLSEDGRIVNISSGAAPSWLQKGTEEAKRVFTNPEITREEIVKLADEIVSATDSQLLAAICQKYGLPDPSDPWFAYGLSKACLNCLTMIYARENPLVAVNGCTPGFIETDLTKPLAESQNKTPSEMGMKPPEAGAMTPCQLLLCERSLLKGNGWFYGSDGKRSPLDKYRSPGDPEYCP